MIVHGEAGADASVAALETAAFTLEAAASFTFAAAAEAAAAPTPRVLSIFLITAKQPTAAKFPKTHHLKRPVIKVRLDTFVIRKICPENVFDHKVIGTNLD